VFSIEEAVRKMTSLPPGQFGFAERGILWPGAVADLVVFDAERVIDRATFQQPDLPSEGIDFVVVNGVPAWREGPPTGERAGCVLAPQASLIYGGTQ
jgi:N-acyl-D-aspartate/D-glutamate deacylase